MAIERMKRLPWTRDLTLGPTKILAWHIFMQHIQKHGSKDGKKYPGWHTNTCKNNLVQHIGDRIPHVIDILRKENPKNGIGELLASRGRLTHELNEIERFQDEWFASTYDVVVHTDEVLHLNRLQELQDKIITSKYRAKGGGPGVYLRWNIENPREIYAGKSLDIDERGHGHTNAAHFLWHVYTTADIETAKEVEDQVHKYLAEIGTPVRTKTKGLYRVKEGNALDLVKAFINKYYDWLFHNSVDMWTEK